MATVCLGYFLASWAMGPVSAILPTIVLALDISVTGAGWIMSTYFLMLVGTVLVMGRLGDLFGHGRVFGLGAALFSGGALLCGLSGSFVGLLVARGVQGLGSAMIFGTSLAIIATAIPARSRGRAIGFLTMSASASALVGVWVSTWSVQHLSWHWAFLFPTPIGILAAVLGWRMPMRRVQLASRKIDWAGAFLLFATIVAAMLGLNHLHEGGESYQEGAYYHLSMHLIAVFLFVAFWKVEERAEAPLLSFKLLRESVFSAGIVGNGIAHMSMLATSFLLPFLLERGRGLTPADTGLLMICQQSAMVGTAVAFGYLYDRTRSPIVGTALMGMIAGGLLTYGLIGSALPYPLLVCIAVSLGAGLGGFTTVNNTALMSMAPQDQRGFASGLVETTRQLGHAVGVSLSSSFMAGALAGAVVPTSAQYVAGFEQAALAMGVVAAVGVLALLWPTIGALVRGAAHRGKTVLATGDPRPIRGASK